MDANVSGSAIENAYQFAANEGRVQEVTAKNPYDHVQSYGRTELSGNGNSNQEPGVFAESASKEKTNSQTVIKAAILSTILFGLALGGILLVTKEKNRLDQTEKQNNEIRTDMQRERREANATWMEKISAVELQVRNMQKDQRKVNETWMKKLSDMQRDQKKVNETWMRKISAVESQVKKLNFLLTVVGWYKASNGFYYKIFEKKQNYTNARLQCQLIVSRLASTGVRDLAVREELITLMEDTGRKVWFGANDMKTEKIFVWEDGITSNGSDIHWARDQPDNKNGNEDCAQYVKWGSWKVNDITCASRLAYMCEKEGNL